MNGKEYLNRVVETIARVGNRGNDNFITAFTLAKSFAGLEAVTYDELLRVDRQIRQGLEHFNVAALYYDGNARYAYQELVIIFNAQEADWKVSGT